MISLKAVFGNVSDKNSFVINNAIDVDQFQFDNNKRLLIRKELNIQPNEIILGFVGRLSSQKNVIYLNKILHECSKVASNISLLIVGEGELFEDMKSDLQKKGIFNKVKFLGNRDNVGEIMMAMDILLLPSLFEGLPLVLVEAQCTSLRCLVSDKITQLVKLTDDIEYLGISNQDINKWVERIISIGNAYPREITNKIQITEKRFNIKQEAKNLEKMYKDLVYN